MRLSDIPDEAFNAKPTHIPTKRVVTPDWAAFYLIVERNGFAIIECDEDEIRTTNIGAEESIPLKAFNSWVRKNFGHHIKTKRLSANRWFVAL